MAAALAVLLILILAPLSLAGGTGPPGTILFGTLSRSRYGFEIFASPVASSSSFADGRLSDGVGVNYNGFFSSDNSFLFVSERGSLFHIFSADSSSSWDSSRRRRALSLSLSLPLLSAASLLDRPSLSHGRLIYVSTQRPAAAARKSWAAVYSTRLATNTTLRLTPLNVADFSPSVSPSGKWTAVASSGESGWSGEVEELNTSIFAFKTADGSRRTLLVEHGGWPCWADDSTLYFHRRAADGWWSVYRASLVFIGADGIQVSSVIRLTSPGFHAFTPAATPAAPGIVAVATRRNSSNFRHIEVLDVSNGEESYTEVTRLINPHEHHYNPFLSPDGTAVGYHRCRGNGNGQSPLMLENIHSPAPEEFSLFRIDGYFPSVSPDGRLVAFTTWPGLYVMNADGSGRPREILSGNTFGTAWDMKRKGVLYTSIGPTFADESSEVDIISIATESNYEIKKLTAGGKNNGFPFPSPDGKWVVFRSGRSGHKNLYIMDAVDGEGAALRRLTEGPWTDTMCSWSPDGEWIAFASNRDKPGTLSFAIYLIHPNGTGLRRVVKSGDGGRANHPFFSPDSKSIVFTSDYAAVSAEPIALPHHFQPYGEIFTAGIDGSNIRRLTHNAYEDGTPWWSPFFLKPEDVVEGSLQGSGMCLFRDCYWLDTDGGEGDTHTVAGTSC